MKLAPFGAGSELDPIDASRTPIIPAQWHFPHFDILVTDPLHRWIEAPKMKREMRQTQMKRSETNMRDAGQKTAI